MEYNVTMPILSDTMDTGKLVKWYVKVGDKVKKGDKLAEIESDKATMDIESFNDGVVKKLLVSENEDVKVKSIIAIIGDKIVDNNSEISVKPKSKIEPKKEISIEKKQDNEFNLDNIINSVLSSSESKSSGTASPIAKKKAKEYGINIENLQENKKMSIPAHEKDIDNEILNKYFTPKSLKLLLEYGIDKNDFKLNHKIDYDEVKKYIIKNNIPKITDLTPNQIAVNKTLEISIKKPTFFIFETIEIVQKDNIKVTAQILKALGNAMKHNFLSRSILKNNKLLTYMNSNISVAVDREDGLFMAVIKNVEEKSLEEINDWLKTIKTKKLTINDLTNSTFGISNLGMFGIDSFSALINDNDSGIMAIGALKDGKTKVTFSFEHRILNGVKAAKFVNDFKEEIKNV